MTNTTNADGTVLDTMAWAESLTTPQLTDHLCGLVQRSHDRYTRQAHDALVLEAANRLLVIHRTLHRPGANR